MIELVWNINETTIFKPAISRSEDIRIKIIAPKSGGSSFVELQLPDLSENGRKIEYYTDLEEEVYFYNFSVIGTSSLIQGFSGTAHSAIFEYVGRKTCKECKHISDEEWVKR